MISLIALHTRDCTDIEIPSRIAGVLWPGRIHAAVRVTGLCKPGPEIHEVVGDRVAHGIRLPLQTIALSLRISLKEENLEELFMGIKPSYIKNLGTALIARQGEYFSKNFEENKQQLGASAIIGSKRVRNRIAGYITRKMNSKKRT